LFKNIFLNSWTYVRGSSKDGIADIVSKILPPVKTPVNKRIVLKQQERNQFQKGMLELINIGNLL